MTSAADRTLKLANSLQPEKGIPVIGLGTWLAPPGEVEEATLLALQKGYKHIDAAAIYKNEPEVGAGIKRWGGDRDSIWVTSKLWNNAHQPAQVPKALEKTLKDLQLEYLDAYLVHWPSPMLPDQGEMSPHAPDGTPLIDKSVSLNETWAAMEDLLATGKVKTIGICNMIQSEVEQILKTAKHKPDIMQMEIHPYLQQGPYVKWLQAQGIVVTAYSPFGNLNPTFAVKDEGKIINHPVILDIAEKYGKTPAQVVLSWGVNHDLSVIPKSTNPKRLEENLGVFNIEPADLAKLDGIDKNIRYNDASEDFGYSFFSSEKSADVVKKQMLKGL